MPKNNTLIKYLLFLIICIIWSTTWAMIKIGLDETPPFLGLALRFSIASIILFAVILFLKKPIPLDWDSIKLYLVAGIFSQAFCYFCTYWGEQYISSSLTSILWTTLPLFVGIFAHFLVPSEKLNFSHIFSIVFATAGVVCILFDQNIVVNKEMVVGSLVVLFGVFIAAWPSVYIKTFKKPYDPIVLTAFSIAIAAVIHTAASTISGDWSRMVWDLKNIGSAVYLAVFGSAIAFIVYYWLLKQIRVVKLSFVTFITPVFACIIGWAFLGEIVTLREIFGMLLIFTGIIIFDWRRYCSFLKVARS